MDEDQNVIDEDGRPVPPPVDEDDHRHGQRREHVAQANGALVNGAVARGVPPGLALEGINLLRTAKGEIKPLYANCVAAIRGNNHFFNLRYDLFTERAYVGGHQLADADFRTIAEMIQRAGVHATTSVIAEAVIKVSEEQTFHQVRDWLDQLKWDGVPRVDMVLSDHAGAEDLQINRMMVSKWMISAVARIYEPGCQADHMLVLEGEQGFKKSRFFSTLGSPWFIDHLSDLTSKDARQELRNGVWICEMAELSSIKRASDMAHVKSFLTTRVDNYRDSYGRTSQAHPRQCVFAATINPGGVGWLTDETGNRRFWPITITREIDIDAVAADREQLWAEAVSRYRGGEAWWLEDAMYVEAAQKLQAERYEGDVWDEVVSKYLVGKTMVSTIEILKEGLSISEVADCGRSEQMRVARILTAMKWVKDRDWRDPKGPSRFFCPNNEYLLQRKVGSK